MALLDDFKARFPEFDEGQVDRYLPILEPVWPSYYGREYEGNEEIVLNLVAHLLVAETTSGPAPAKNVASQSVESVSVSYVAPASSPSRQQDFFSTTKYGARFLQLIAPLRGGVFV